VGEGIEELEGLFGDLAERVGPSVVRIGRSGRGAGIVIERDRILTNAHNLRGEEVTVAFADGRQATADVLGVDVDGDLAIVTTSTDPAPAIEWDPAAVEARLGQPVFSVTGTGDSGTRVTTGYVSAVGRAFRGPRGRRIRGGFEHTAPLGRGASGGPVLDRAGRFLGINTHRLGEGFYLAVPADADLARRSGLLARGETPHQLRLGVGIADPETTRRLRRAVGLPDRDGLLVRVVEAGSPAERAEIARGDLLVRIGATPLVTADDLFDALSGLHPGESVEIALVRGAEELVVAVELEPADEPTDS
jgi:serine protease Do